MILSSRCFLWDGIVTGPVRSRRFGNSLGINLLPARSKLCSFNCPYCECGLNTPRAAGSRWPSPDEVAHQLRRALAGLPALPDWITVTGNGEPTLHPRFPVVVDRVLAARDASAPRVPVGILSNGVTAGRGPVRDALRRLDGRFMKLDPGPSERVNGVPVEVDQLVASYRALKPYAVQAMVVRGPGWNGGDEAALAAWLPLLQRADPDVVQLYSVDRAPASDTMERVPPERLSEMADAIREALPRCVVEVS
jgi:wyosine [tRNA(Phe)-imidazoG37] synthetase (radical SAM superfamily)